MPKLLVIKIFIKQLKFIVMSISDYSVEGLEIIWDMVDEFFNWDENPIKS